MIKVGDLVKTNCELYVRRKYEAGVVGVVIAKHNGNYVCHAVGDFMGHNCELRGLPNTIYKLIKDEYNDDRKCFMVRSNSLTKLDEYKWLNSDLD